MIPFISFLMKYGKLSSYWQQEFASIVFCSQLYDVQASRGHGRSRLLAFLNADVSEGPQFFKVGSGILPQAKIGERGTLARPTSRQMPSASLTLRS